MRQRKEIIHSFCCIVIQLTSFSLADVSRKEAFHESASFFPSSIATRLKPNFDFHYFTLFLNFNLKPYVILLQGFIIKCNSVRRLQGTEVMFTFYNV